MQAPPLSAHVFVAEDLSGLIVQPRDPKSGAALLADVRSVLRDLPLRRGAGGVHVPSWSAPQLFERLGSDARFAWTEGAVCFAQNRARAAALHPRIATQVKALRNGGADVAGPHLHRAGAGVLDGHQVVNVAAMTLAGGPGLCVFDEQGAGKTVSLIYAFDLLVGRDQADFVLIVAPKSMVPEWPKDFERFMAGVYRTAMAAGSRREKLAALRSGAEVIVTNFETAVSMEAELEALLRSKRGRAILVVDESFYVKSLDAQRTRALRRLREWCSRAFVLCGTPAPNSPHDLIQQASLVDFGYTFAGVEVPAERLEAAPIVQAAFEDRALYTRHLKQDVLPGLPGKTFHRVLVPLQPVQRRLYEAALKDYILDLQATDDEGFRRQLASFLAKRSALLQLCSSPASLATGYDEVPAKILALDSLLDELIGRRREKVILWSFYTDAVTQLVERYANYGAVRYDGAVSDVAERRDAVRKFQEDDETMVFVANPAAAGAGLTLHRARFAIYELMSNQAAHYLQSLDRIHRRGQDREVEYFILLCDGTIEVDEYKRLVTKERAAQDLLGDIVTAPVTREAWLAEASAAASLLGRAA